MIENSMRDYKKQYFSHRLRVLKKLRSCFGSLPAAEHFRGLRCPKTLINGSRRGNGGIVDPPIKKQHH